MNFFDTILYQPLFNFLIVLYQFLPGKDFGVAVIVLTVLIRFLLYPLVAESIRVQKITTSLQPKMKEIQDRYKNNKEKQAAMMMELWKKHKINPFSVFLFLLIQLPILWALYRVFLYGLKNGSLSSLYSFVPNPGTINPVFFGVVNLSEAYPLFAVLAGILQFVQVKMMTPQLNKKTEQLDQSEKFATMIQKQSLYIFPIITVAMFWSWPSALGLYWIVTSIFSIIQQYFILKNHPNETEKLALSGE